MISIFFQQVIYGIYKFIRKKSSKKEKKIDKIGLIYRVHERFVEKRRATTPQYLT